MRGITKHTFSTDTGYASGEAKGNTQAMKKSTGIAILVISLAVGGGFIVHHLAQIRAEQRIGSQQTGSPADDYPVGSPMYRRNVAFSSQSHVITDRALEIPELKISKEEGLRRLRIVFKASDAEMDRVKITDFQSPFNVDAVPHCKDIPPLITPPNR
jgi:hypothetical protein